MSPVDQLFKLREICFPRVSGDEPVVMGALRAAVEFSPRERG